MDKNDLPHVVVLGGGFGGLEFCKRLPEHLAKVTLIDRENHHLFQPLLYQVATAGLSSSEIAQPIRSILSDRENLVVLLNEVREIDLEQKLIRLADREMRYDFLVVALGGVTSYFGHPEWEEHAPGLKSLRDALRIRHDVLAAFERAENETDATIREHLMTMVVVGGGPTGVEMAGSLAELSKQVLRRDFAHIDPANAKVILLEGGERVLSHLSPELSDHADQQLRSLGVDVHCQARVEDVNADGLMVNGEFLPAATKVWAAGIGANPVVQALTVPKDRAGCILVEPSLRLPGHPEAFAIGDIAHVKDENGRRVPGVSPAAMQMAAHVAEVIMNEITAPSSTGSPAPAFRYFDKGSMATIGRSRAVAQVGGFEFSGFAAWLSWLFVHLVFLVGFRNRLAVFVQWIYSYFTFNRGARIISHAGPDPRMERRLVDAADGR